MYKKKDYKELSRTQLLIINSLLALMKKEDFNKITVTQIIQESEIARGTFYLNFKTKEEVIRCFMEVLIIDYDTKISQYENHTPHLMCKHFFEYWLHHLDFAELLNTHHLFYLLLEAFENYMNQISIKKNPSEVFNVKPLTNLELEYFSSFNSAGLWNMLLRWLQKGAKETPEEMAQMYDKFM